MLKKIREYFKYPKKVGLHARSSWKAPIMFFQFKCSKHGLVVDYKHGYSEKLECPVCFWEKYKHGYTQ